MLLSSNVALIGGNSTKPGSSYYALIKAVLSLLISYTRSEAYSDHFHLIRALSEEFGIRFALIRVINDESQVHVWYSNVRWNLMSETYCDHLKISEYG